ncbi:MAG: hypothetical protein CM1200mP18_18420 [Gammaproteobacteria bacterium]|nr:MAG: hypothetical protein CM1200mP18_18420 [Gammaproteobacteria bacterium]
MAGSSTGLARGRYNLWPFDLGFAFLLAQFGTEPWHFYVTTGVMAGIAMTAIGMTTATVLVTRWYQGPRAGQLSPVIGIVYSGLGAGVILWVPITNQLIEILGWRETYRVLGLILCAVAIIVFALPWKKLQVETPPYSDAGRFQDGERMDTCGRTENEGVLVVIHDYVYYSRSNVSCWPPVGGLPCVGRV